MASSEEILRLSIDSRPAEEGARRYSRSIDEVRTSSGQAASSVDDAEKKFRGLAVAAGGTAALLAGKVSAGFRGFGGLVRGVSGYLVDLTAVGLSSVSRGLRMMSDGMRDANGDLTAMGRVTGVAASGFDKLGDVVHRVGQVLFGLKLAAGAAAVTVGVLAHRAASEFTPAWNRVLTLLGEGEFDSLRAEVSGLAADMGVDGVQGANAFYQVLSAMPQLADEPTEALKVLDAVLQATDTGFTEAGEAAAAITGILNAFNLEASESTRVADALFLAQDKGVTTFGEIAASIGTVADLASSLGGRFEDLLGILATTTDTGVDTAMRFTQLRGVISAIVKPTEQAKEAMEGLDMDLNAATLSSLGLNETLLRLIDVTGGNPDVLAQIFPQESLGLILALARQTDVLREKTEAIGNSAGKTGRNVEIMNQGWGAAREDLSEAWADTLRQIGFNFEGIGVKGVQSATAVLNSWRETRDMMRGFRDEQDAMIADANREWEQSRFNDGAPVQFGAVVVSPTGPRRSDPITRPSEPIGAEYTTDKIRSFSDAQRLAAVETLAATGNLVEYERATRRAQEAVNELVLSEVARNREAGVSEDELGKIATLFNRIADQKERLTDVQKAMQSVTEEIRQMSIAYGHWLQDIGVGRTSAAEIGHGVLRRDFNPATGRPDNVSDSLTRNATTERGRIDAARYRELEQAEQAGDSLARTASDVARGVIDVADAFGGLDDGTRRAVSGIAGMIAALDSFDANGGMSLANIGSVVGMAGAFAQLAASAFTESASERERNDIIRRNTEALEQMTVALTGGDYAAAGSAVSAAVGDSDLMKWLSTGATTGHAEYQNKFLLPVLADAGISLAELDAIAKEAGITLRNEAGIVIPEALEQLHEALGPLIARLFEFGDSVADQTRVMNARAEIFDYSDDPGKVLQDQLAMMAHYAPDLFGGASNLDLSEQGDRALFEAMLRDVFTRLTSGELSPEMFGEFTDKDQLLDALLGADRGLDAFVDSLNEATGAVTDIPKAINLALYRRQFGTGVGDSMDDGHVGWTPPGSNETPPWEDPNRRDPVPPDDGSGGGGRRARPQLTVTFEEGSIVTQAQSGEALLLELEQAIQERWASGELTYLPGAQTST